MAERIYLVPRDNVAQRTEINNKTEIEYALRSKQADKYGSLAEAIGSNAVFTIPKPMTQERLEQILPEFGLMGGAEENYSI